MKRAIGVSLLAGIVLVFALVTGFSLLTRLFYVLALTVAGSFLWAWLSLRWLEIGVERRTPRVHVGALVDERITVRNQGWLPKPWLEVVELTDIPGHQSGMTVSLPGKGFRSWRTSTRSSRRGVYRLGPLRIATGDALGLFRLERQYAGSQQVLVLPAVLPIARFVIPSADMPGDGPVRQRSFDVTPHAASVRDYVPGDSVSRIHWPTSARTGQLAVKEFDLGLTSDVWVLLDLEAVSHLQDGEDSAEEMAVTAAASIARHLLLKGQPVGLAVNGQPLAMVPPDRGYLQDARFLDMLAQVNGDGAVPLHEAIAHVDPWLGRHTTLVVVTSSSSPRWLEALDNLAHRSVRLAAVLIDGATFGGGDSPRALLPALSELGATSYVVGKGDDMSRALSYPSTAQRDVLYRVSGGIPLSQEGVR